MASKKDRRLGWHFLPKSLKLEYGDGRTVEVGKTLSISPSETPMTCSQGMHASEKIRQAATFNRGPVVCRVEVKGDIDTDRDKFCGRSRTVLWMKELTTKDIQDCLVSIGFKTRTNVTKTMDSLQHQLADACGNTSYQDKADAWLMKWAEKNGCLTPVALTYVKKEITENELKKFLTPRVVRTAKEIRADMVNLYECDGDDEPLEEMLENYAGYGDICMIDNYTENGDAGFVLKLKRKR